MIPAACYQHPTLMWCRESKFLQIWFWSGPSRRSKSWLHRYNTLGHPWYRSLRFSWCLFCAFLAPALQDRWRKFRSVEKQKSPANWRPTFTGERSKRAWIHLPTKRSTLKWSDMLPSLFSLRVPTQSHNFQSSSIYIIIEMSHNKALYLYSIQGTFQTHNIFGLNIKVFWKSYCLQNLVSTFCKELQYQVLVLYHRHISSFHRPSHGFNIGKFLKLPTLGSHLRHKY